MIRGGAFAVALAATMIDTKLVKPPEMVSHTVLEERYAGPALKDRIRGVVGAGHSPSLIQREPPPCTYRRKPGKRARRRARGKARAA